MKMTQKSKACTVELPRKGFADALRRTNYVATPSPQVLLALRTAHPKWSENWIEMVDHGQLNPVNEEPIAAIVTKLLISVRNRITLARYNGRTTGLHFVSRASSQAPESMDPSMKLVIVSTWHAHCLVSQIHK